MDEPAAKAVFDVTLIVPKGLAAVSNTVPEVVEEHVPGYQVVKFAPTPKMSTYLLAFIVGDLEYVEGKTKEGIIVRVFTTPGKKKQAEFALGVAKKTVSFFNDYFGIAYPLPVLDLIAIPDFQAAAMENWGAITFRERAILIDPQHSSEQIRRWVALVIAHEIAHQWFGNLVTMEWWTHLWLNEGFARFCEHLALHKLFPKWKVWRRFSQSVLGEAMSSDSLLSTHPIEVPVHHPDEVNEIFDDISYAKGAAVIKMLAEYLGPKDFRNGLRHYLDRHSYKNATTDDLWAAFEHISKKPVREMMHAWTRRPGYPLINIVDKGRKLELSQKRFFVSPISARKAKDRTRWLIPLKIAAPGRDKKYLLGKEPLNLPDTGKWLKLNSGETTLCTVDYPAPLLRRLAAAVRAKKLSPEDRMGLTRDAFALAEAGRLSTREVLIFLEAYQNENDYGVWLEIASGLGRLNPLFYEEKFYEDYRRYAREIFRNIVKRCGWRKLPNEDADMPLLRSLVLYQSGRYGDTGVIREAQELFTRSVPLRGISRSGIKKRLDPDLRDTVYYLAAENGGPREYRELMRRYLREPMQEEKARLAGALGRFRQRKLLMATLRFLLSARVRVQDMPLYTVHLMLNVYGRELGWKFLKRNWPELMRRYGGGVKLLTRAIEPLAYFSSEAKAQEIRKFFRKHPARGEGRTVAKILEKISGRAAWRKRDSKTVGEWLRANYPA